MPFSFAPFQKEGENNLCLIAKKCYSTSKYREKLHIYLLAMGVMCNLSLVKYKLKSGYLKIISEKS